MPIISVIIPCYNLGKYLEEAVNSVLSQTFQDFEIIIVNDGSTDEFTNNLLANYNRPKTKVLITDNQGLPSARNNGIKIAEGKYICCLDADDRYAPEFLQKSIAVLEKDEKCELGFVTTWIQEFEKRSNIVQTSDFKPYKLAIENLIHVASLFRKECWEKVRGYATNLSGYQDWNLWISIVSKGYKWSVIEEPLFFYRIRENSMLTKSDKNKIHLYAQIIENNLSFYKENIKQILLEVINYPEQVKSMYLSSQEAWNKWEETNQRLIDKDKDLIELNEKLYKTWLDGQEAWHKWEETNQKLIDKDRELVEMNKKLSQTWLDGQEAWRRLDETNKKLIEKEKELQEIKEKFHQA